MQQQRIEQLAARHQLPRADWLALLSGWDDDDRRFAAELAQACAVEQFGRRVFTRGIVEFSNICKNDCYYCGIRRSNQSVHRYRLTEAEILACCETGYAAGFRTIVLQSGEDGAYTPARLAALVRQIKAAHPDCAVTLSVGELEHDDLAMLRAAGADRYLLRHETADPVHYGRLHPESMSLAHRMQCLRDLKALGFQTGAGMMVGSPYQTVECLAADMEFLAGFQPHMVGIGPFLPHADTPVRDFPAGSYALTLFLLSLVRLMLPKVLLPATTALGTIAPDGREQGILAGANVIMPNLSPENVRKDYLLYNNKIGTAASAADGLADVRARMTAIGYTLAEERGDHPDV